MHNLSKLSLAEKLLICGNILGSVSMALISIGAILRKSDLPDTPLFGASAGESSSSVKDINRNTNHSNNYWGK